MNLQLHLTTPPAVATPMSLSSHAGTGDVFRGTMQSLLSSSLAGTQLTPLKDVSTSVAQQPAQPLSLTPSVMGASMSPANADESDTGGAESNIPLAGFLPPDGLMFPTANARPERRGTSTTSIAVEDSSVPGQPATKRSAAQDKALDSAMPTVAAPLPVVQAQDAPTQGTIPTPSSLSSPAPNPTLSLTMREKVKQGTARPTPLSLASSGDIASNGLQLPSASGNGVAAHDPKTLQGAAALPSTKAHSVDEPVDSLSQLATQGAPADSPIPSLGQSGFKEDSGALAPHANLAVAKASNDGGIAISASASMRGAGAIKSGNTPREKTETTDGAVTAPSTPAAHQVGLSLPVHGTSSGSTAAAMTADARGSNTTTHTLLRESSTAQVLQKMDMPASAEAVPLRADARHLNVGIQSAAYGWVEVRATAGSAGHVEASLHVQSSVSAETLAAHTKDIASYVREQSIQMGQVSVGVETGEGGRQNSRSASADTAREGIPSPLISSDAETDEVAYGALDTLSLISLRA